MAKEKQGNTPTNQMTQAEARASFRYKEGDLFWGDKGPNRRMDKPCGYFDKSSKYCRVTTKGTTYQKHVLVWNYHRGIIPIGRTIDHENSVKTDNRIENLRLATPREQTVNRGLNSNNTSGYKGVYWGKKTEKWMAKIRVDGVLLHLGFFSLKEDALAARKAAELKYFNPEFIPSSICPSKI